MRFLMFWIFLLLLLHNRIAIGTEVIPKDSPSADEMKDNAKIRESGQTPPNDTEEVTVNEFLTNPENYLENNQLQFIGQLRIAQYYVGEFMTKIDSYYALELYPVGKDGKLLQGKPLCVYLRRNEGGRKGTTPDERLIQNVAALMQRGLGGLTLKIYAKLPRDGRGWIEKKFRPGLEIIDWQYWDAKNGVWGPLIKALETAK